jgi:hypothetical protein
MKLTAHNRVQLIWVPGQKVVKSNETAEQLTRLGSECPSIIPEPECSISGRIAEKVVNICINRDHRSMEVLNRAQMMQKVSYKDHLSGEASNYQK